MKKICFLSFLICWMGIAQKNGDILSRTVVTLPPYEHIPSIEMYYDKQEYDSALADKLVGIDRITYYSDGLKVIAYLSYPLDGGHKSYPVIIFNRGSGIRNDIAQVHAPLFKKLVHAGFVVLAPALRGSEGGEGTDEIGGDDIYDILNTLPLLKQMAIADTSRMFMLGESRGGIMTYLALRKKFPVGAAAVIGSITDMSMYLEGRPWAEKFFQEHYPAYADKKDSILQSRSAVFWAEDVTVPLLIMNGQADPQVAPAHALQMADKLAALNKDFQLIILQQGNHILSGPHTERRDREVIDWFKKFLN